MSHHLVALVADLRGEFMVKLGELRVARETLRPEGFAVGSVLLRLLTLSAYRREVVGGRRLVGERLIIARSDTG